MNLSNVKNNIYDYLLCGLILVLPYSLKLPNLFLLAAILFFFLDYKSFKVFNFRTLKSLPFIVLFAFLCYLLVKALLTNTISENKYGLLLLIAVLPILFIKVKDYKKIFFSVTVTGFLLTTTAIYGVMRYYFTHKQLLPFEGESVNEILNMERPYLGFFIVFSIICSFKMAELMNRYKWLFYINILYATVAVFLISARISSITILILIGLYLIFYLKTTRKYKIIISTLSIVFLSITVLLSKSLQERLFILSNFEESIAKLNLYEPRVIIWPCSYEIATSENFNPIIGINSQNEIDALLAECYDHKIVNRHRANFFIESKLNTHNQFLGYYLAAGIVGIVLLVLFFGLQLYRNRKDFINTALLISLLLFFTVENVLYRQLGVYLFIIIISIINIYRPSDSIERKEENI